MAQFYSDESRQDETYALPDAEVFYISKKEIASGDWDETIEEPGWYYWFCFPGCMPDSEPFGPFESEQAAIDDAREQSSY